MADTRVHDFHGGLHIPDHKAESNSTPVQPMPLPKRLVVPLQQHIGQIAEAVVAVGDKIDKGQLIARASDYVSANIHAPSSGTVSDISEQPIAHPSGLSAACIVIDTDGEDRWGEMPEPMADWASRSADELRERLRWAGVVGLGGAVFPTSVKINTTSHRVDTLVINAAECEPYITCDDRLMREQADDVLDGVQILQHIIEASTVLIGIEDNKPEAAQALRDALAARGTGDIQIRVLPTKYPSGGEKQLIQLLTGIEVPSQGLPLDIGIVCQNVATCAAVADAVLRSRPLISRIVTLTGQGLKQPGNVRALIGTPVSDLIAQAGGYTDASRLIMGGPMMGFALHSDEVPLTKGGNCFIATNEAEMAPPSNPQPCIRCGECVKVCPALLLPQQLYWYARARDFDKAQDQHLFDCIECGCCAHVCPSNIPLVHYYRFAKTEVWAAERERQQADLARRRHEFREARKERLEAERKARLRKKKEDLEKKPAKTADKSGDPKKAAIEAAMKRVAEKKAKAAAQAEQTTDQAGDQ